MNSKAIKRQLLAAIAMVLVAAVALGSSTYAWFVSNNTVTATTSTISAQSNAPFLMIDKSTISTSSGTSISYATEANVALYPAQVVKAAGTETYPSGSSTATMDADKPLFQSAYAKAANATTILDDSRYNVGDVATAVAGEFAIKESFKIGTADAKAGSFKDLKVSKVELTSAGTDGLEAALSVLVVCGDNWAVYKASNDGAVLTAYNDSTPAVGTATTGVLAATIEAGAAKSVAVDVYVFYDGSAAKVYTDNLTNLTAIGATITFTATPVNTQGTEVNSPNSV